MVQTLKAPTKVKEGDKVRHQESPHGDKVLVNDMRREPYQEESIHTFNHLCDGVWLSEASKQMIHWSSASTSSVISSSLSPVR